MTTKHNITPEAIAWAQDYVSDLRARGVLSSATAEGVHDAAEIITDDPDRRAALRTVVASAPESLPSIARDLARLAREVYAASNTLSEAARASARGDNEAREDLIRKAREELRAVLANDVFTLAPEVSK